MDYILHEVYASSIPFILIFMLFLLIAWSVIGAAFYKRMRVIGAAAAVISAAVIVFATLISRGEAESEVFLEPFSSFARAWVQPEMYRSMLMNVILFMPLGMSMPYVFSGSAVKRALLTVLTGFLLSIGVETIQYIFSLGMSETDDVICNTLGTVIGSSAYALSYIWKMLIAELKKRREAR